MLAPLVLKSLAVLIEEAVSLRVEAHHFCRCPQDLAGLSAFHRYAVQLGHGTGRIEGTRCRVLDGGGEEHLFAVWSKCGGKFGSRMGGQASGGTPIGRHDIHVEVPVPVAGKCQVFPVGRPDRGRFIRVLSGETHGFTSVDCYLVNVSFVAEGNLLAVGRDADVTHPQGSGCMDTGCCQSDGKASDESFHDVFIVC